MTDQQEYCFELCEASYKLRSFLDKVFQNTKQAIRQTVGDNIIYFHLDETTNSCGRYIANLLIGTLTSEKSGTSYLIGSKAFVKKVVITRFIHEDLTYFFLPEPVPVEKIILVSSDAAISGVWKMPNSFFSTLCTGFRE